MAMQYTEDEKTKIEGLYSPPCKFVGLLCFVAGAVLYLPWSYSRSSGMNDCMYACRGLDIKSHDAWIRICLVRMMGVGGV